MPADPITITCPACSRAIKVPLLNANITPETYAQVHRYAQRADGGRAMNESEEALLTDLERAQADLEALRLEHDAWGVLLDAARRDRDEARRERDALAARLAALERALWVHAPTIATEPDPIRALVAAIQHMLKESTDAR